MRIISKTILFIIIAMTMASLGCLVNGAYLESELRQKTLEMGKKSYENYFKHYDPKKKTIVVFGTSTSIYSFRNGLKQPDEYSYVDVVQKNVNILRLTSISLRKMAQLETLLDFINSQAINIDLVIFENLSYLKGDEVFAGFQNPAIMASCWQSSSQYLREQCQLLVKELVHRPVEFIEHPCLKKNRNKYSAVYNMTSKDRISHFSKLLKCGESFGRRAAIRQFIIDEYHYGYAQDVRESFSRNNVFLDTESVIASGINEYEASNLISFDFYLRKIGESYPWKKFLVIPSYSKKNDHIKRLPVFTELADRMSFLSMSDDIKKNSQEKKLKMENNFYDGSHANVWIHQIIASKVLEILSLNQVDNNEQ